MMTYFTKIIILIILTFTFKPTSNIPYYISNPASKEWVFTINTDRYLGIPYKLGGKTPKGIDCSFLTYKIFKDNDIKMPQNSYLQSQQGTQVYSLDSIIKGDLLFFKTSNNRQFSITHVAIYIGNNQILHSTNRGVVIDQIDSRIFKNYYLQRLVIIKRVNLESNHYLIP